MYQKVKLCPWGLQVKIYGTKVYNRNKKGCTNGQKGAKNVQNMTIMGHNRCKNLKWVNKGCRKGAWAVRRNLASKVFNLSKKNKQYNICFWILKKY